MFSLNPSYNKLCVLFPKDLDIKSIQKCPIDFNCEFAPLDDKATIDGLGPSSKFVIFQKDYFIAHMAGHEIKCDYNCRNRVMTNVFKLRSLEPPLDEDRKVVYNHIVLLQISSIARNNELINGIVHNNELPHMIFSNESLPGDDNYLTNSIMEHYISLDIQTFAEITKSKPCNHDSFVVHFVDENLQDRKRKPFPNHQFICCNMKTLETYEYSWDRRSVVEKALKNDLDGCIAKWKAEDEALKLTEPAERVPDFHLLDFEGHAVEENTDYYLQMYDQPEDVLKLLHYRPVIYATYHLNHADRIVVRYSIVNGIHYLTRENQFLQVTDNDEIGFMDDNILKKPKKEKGTESHVTENNTLKTVHIPKKEKRIEFHVTENNTFKIVQWDKDIWLSLHKETFNYSSVTFNDNEAIVRRGKPLELLLKRVQT
jgi:hypothetical protein